MATHLTIPVAGDAPRRDPAPGELELIRQLVNTYDVEDAWPSGVSCARAGA